VLRRAAQRIGGGVLPLSGQKRRALLRYAERNVFGIDIDAHARLLALDAIHAAVREVAPGPLPPDFLHGNVVADDFLLGESLRRLPPMRRGGFAFVVGNPPYVATTRLDARQKTLLRTLFATAVGRVDLYTLFFERGLQLLGADGVLAFITPDKFLASETSKALRTFLTRHGSIRRIARFRSHKVFPGAAVVPCVTVIERRESSEVIEVLAVASHRGSEVTISAASTTSRSELGEAPWQFRSPALLALVERLQGAHPGLESLSQRISAGPATGNDAVYVRPAAELAHVEQELVRPAVRGRDISAFSVVDPELRILLPFEFRDDGPRLVSLSRFPNARRYLERHRKALEQRHCVRVWEKPWFDLHDLPATDIAYATKILVPDVAESCRFAVDAGKYFPLHSAYYIVLKDAALADYITAILNSTVIEFAIRLLAPVAKDGFSRFRRQFLATLPIPLADGHERRALVRLAAAEDRSSTDARVAKLFGLQQRDLRTMQAFLAGLGRGDLA
jgi:hypothetical protein